MLSRSRIGTCLMSVQLGEKYTVGTKRELKLGDMNRRQSLRDQVPGFVAGPFENIVLTDPKSKENLKWKDHTIGLIAEKTGKHVVDAMLDIAVSEELETNFLNAA